MPETWRECEGQVVDGQFQLLQHLGGSDHSVVFLTQRGKGQQEKAAIKFLPAEGPHVEAQLSRWKAAAQLSHPNLIKLFESGRCNLAGMDLIYVVMEYAAENLAEFLPTRALSPAETRDMLEPFVDALGFLHGKGFIHGGIKPGNILAIDDQLKLSSDSIRRKSDSQIGSTKASAYVPPEAAQGENSESGDVWALGVTLVEALTQRAPERTGGEQEPQVGDTLPQPFLDIARHSLTQKPKERWTIAQISACLNPQKAAPPPPPSPPPAAKQEILTGANLIGQQPAAVKTASAAGAAVATAPAAAAAAPAKSAVAIDPLSVPLSPVEPLHGSKKQALENQVIAGTKAPSRGYYLVVAVVIALTLGALLVIPRFRDRSTSAEPAASTAPSQPDAQPSATPPRAETAPPTPVKSQPKPEPRKATPPPVTAPQRSAAEPKQSPAQASVQTAAGTAQAKGDDFALSNTPASLRSAVPAAPFVHDREASIKAGAVAPGEVLNQVLPEVSEKSRSTIHGTVRTVIKVHVDSSGSVSAAEVASAPSKFFASAALDAAKQWDFAPAKIDGHAVPSEWLLHFDFTQTDTKVSSLPTKP
jgi:TonB family protein